MPILKGDDLLGVLIIYHEEVRPFTDNQIALVETFEVDVFPQEITRALLNLISNGFYAATKRKEHDDSEGYEPTLTAATKNLGDRVEIRIRDNGTGIPPE